MIDEDPTKIPVFLDQKQHIIRGTTYHGNMVFECPLITPVAHNLWQGGCEPGLKLHPRFHHIISLYPWGRYKFVRVRMSTEVYIAMLDAEDQALDQIDALARLVNVCRADAPVLVHCQAGLNRSSLVVARALWLDGRGDNDYITMTGNFGDGNAIVELLREKRSPAVLCNPAFEAEVRSW